MDAAVSAAENRWKIVGGGLAGCCLAWNLWERGIPFKWLDGGRGGSSRVAAGMINPVTGKNFEPSWRIAEFLPEAMDFYVAVENQLGRKLWHPLPVVRLARADKEWRKIQSKLDRPEVARWVVGEVIAPEGWAGAVELTGGGRLDTRAFIEGSWDFLKGRGVQCEEREAGEVAAGEIRCEGALGLMAGHCGPHRCAKGEILTVRADWDESRIRIGAGGWLVPCGGGIFRAGSTYDWNELDEIPTATGRTKVEEIARQLGGDDFEVIGHDAGIRPILRRSEPLIGPLEIEGAWMFNGLGSKGSLYAPGVARRLADWLVDGMVPEADLDFRNFRGGPTS